MFSVEERDAARAFVLKLASEDSRVTAAAVVGSFARGTADRWSDLDLTFAVADSVRLADVISDWTRELEAELDAVPVWDLSVRSRIAVEGKQVIASRATDEAGNTQPLEPRWNAKGVANNMSHTVVVEVRPGVILG